MAKKFAIIYGLLGLIATLLITLGFMIYQDWVRSAGDERDGWWSFSFPSSLKDAGVKKKLQIGRRGLGAVPGTIRNSQLETSQEKFTPGFRHNSHTHFT